MTICEEIKGLQAEKAQLEAALADSQAKAMKDATDRDAQISQLKAQVDGLTAAAAKVDAEHKAAIDLLAKERDGERDKAKALAGELETAKKILANPAYQAAQAQGASKSTPEGAAVTVDEPEFESKQEADAAYRKLTDPKEMAEFRQKNWKILGLDPR